MAAPIGRNRSAVRTPQLVRDYLTGAREFPGDTSEERAARPVTGDYISRMHARIKRHIREIKPAYQWPRGHSFRSLIRNLRTLGLVETTGAREPGKPSPAEGFEERTFIKLAPGSAARPEWDNIPGALAIYYPNILLNRAKPVHRRPPARDLPRPSRKAGPAAQQPREKKPRGPTAAPAPTAPPPQLLTQAKELEALAGNAAVRGSNAQTFIDIYNSARAWFMQARPFTAPKQEEEIQRSLELIRSCAQALSDPKLAGPMRARQLQSCRSAAQILREALTGGLRPQLSVEEIQEKKKAAKALKPRAPKKPPVPKSPELNLQDLDADRKSLQLTARRLGRDGAFAEDFAQFGGAAAAFAAIAGPAMTGESLFELRQAVDELQACAAALQRSGIPEKMRREALGACRNAAQILAAVLARPLEQKRGGAG